MKDRVFSWMCGFGIESGGFGWKVIICRQMVNQGCDENFLESLELEEKMVEDRDLRNLVFCDKGEIDKF